MKFELHRIESWVYWHLILYHSHIFQVHDSSLEVQTLSDCSLPPVNQKGKKNEQSKPIDVPK